MSVIKEYAIKIVIIGEPGVGKTSLVQKFVSGHFSKDYRSTIGTNIFTKKINLDERIKVTMQLWDIAGQERWVLMRKPYYKGADGALIVGDLTRKNTFYQIEKYWVQDLKKYCKNLPIILLANKNDLKRDIAEKEILLSGKRLNFKEILVTSAKTGENVEKAFKIISEQAVKHYS